jgi:cytoskeletal protein CcmA (bactofilin family)
MMFRRKKTDAEEAKPAMSNSDDLGIPAKPAGKAMPLASPPKVPGLMMRANGDTARGMGDPPRTAAELSRRLDAVQSGGSGHSSPAGLHAGGMRSKPETELRKLIVGREITLTGEIKSCDRLVVEGSVEANLANCRDMDIAESGCFKGSAAIDDAEIRGRFDGVLTVHKRLLIRATGKVTGTVRYGQLEIECGGQISGDVQVQQGNPPQDKAEEPEPSYLAAEQNFNRLTMHVHSTETGDAASSRSFSVIETDGASR